MNTKIFPALLVVVLVIGGYLYVQGQSKTMNKSTDTMMQKEDAQSTPKGDAASSDAMEKTSDTMAKAESRYLPYTADAYEAAKGKKRVLYFHAPWCPTCVPTDKEFEAKKSSIPQDVVLFKTDYDSSTELKQKYAVTYQHTFVQVNDLGEIVSKWNGGGLSKLIDSVQ